MIIPYLCFKNNAAEAIAFYERAFNATDVKIMRFGDAPPNPEYPIPEEHLNLVMHSEMTVYGARVYISDSPTLEENPGNRIMLSLECQTPEQVTAAFNALKEGGVVMMPCEETFFAHMYGWLTDKFGISWQILCRK